MLSRLLLTSTRSACKPAFKSIPALWSLDSAKAFGNTAIAFSDVTAALKQTATLEESVEVEMLKVCIISFNTAGAMSVTLDFS